MGIFLAMGALFIIAITAIMGIVLALRHDLAWKNWLLGTLAGFVLFFTSLFIIPDPTANLSPAVNQQQTTQSAVYK